MTERFLKEEDVPSVLMLMNCYPAVLKEMIACKRFTRVVNVEHAI